MSHIRLCSILANLEHRIPFERALEFANKEKITDQLYPLFVHNIGGLLYNPENAPRTQAVVQAADRRRVEAPEATRTTSTPQAPSLHHHHSMQNGTPAQVPPTPHSVGPAGRPGLDRAHTFPTPPTSASSVMGMGTSGSYDWNNQNISNGVSGAAPLSIDTGMNARSMPTTPATTPPGNNVQNVNSYQSHPTYDSKHYYATTPSSQTGYAQQQNGRYDAYNKSDMGPPTAPPSGSTESHDHKSENYASEHAGQSDSAEHQQNGYMSNNASTYSRNQYSYGAGADHQHLSPEMTSSPSHPNNSGRGTPRTMPSQSQWQADYHTPPRVPTSGNLYNAVGDSRATNGSNAYSTSSYTASNKRGRDEEDDDKLDGYKRQKMGRADTFGMPLTPNVHMQAIKTGGGLPGQR